MFQGGAWLAVVPIQGAHNGGVPMKQSATTRTVRRTVDLREHRLTCMRMRLHLPRRHARDELRALVLGDVIEAAETADAARTSPSLERRL